jgi:hypothetical protein
MLLDWLKYLIGPSVLVALWELYKFLRGRTFQSRLRIDISSSATPLGKNHLVFVDVQVTNFGKGKIQARPVGDGEWAYKDQFETVAYSGSLQIKQIDAASVQGNEALDWFKSAAVKEVPGISEINLLDEYALTDKNNRIEFWLEPDETVHLGTAVVLSPGHYLLKASFYGTKPEDFWHHLACVYLPAE